jgi:hypothetical protein
MSHSMWLARVSRIVGNRRWQAGRQRENLRSAQLPCHHAPTFLVISPQTHTSPSLWEMPPESFPVDRIKECILCFVLRDALDNLEVSPTVHACRGDLWTAHHSSSELKDTAPRPRSSSMLLYCFAGGEFVSIYSTCRGL